MIYRMVTELLFLMSDGNPASMREDISLEELGLDSLAQVELADRLAEMFKVGIPDDNLTGRMTVRGIVGLIEEKQETA